MTNPTHISKKFSLFFMAVLFIVVPFFLTHAQSGDVPPADGSGTIPPETPAGSTSVPPETPTSTPSDTSGTTAGAGTPPSSTTGATTPPVSTPPRGTPPPVAPISNTSIPTTNTVLNNQTASSENEATASSENKSSSTIPWIIGGIAALGGFTAFFLRTKKKKSKKGNRCENIKKQLEQKKEELTGVKNKFSLQETLVEKLKEKVDEKKEELKESAMEKAKEVVKEKILRIEEESKIGKAVGLAEKGQEHYDNISEKYEQGKTILETLRAKQNGLSNEVQTLQTAYSTCMASTGVSRSVTGGAIIKLPDFSKEKPKLFLTSSGFSDKNEKEFLRLLDKDPKGLKVAFIPTAMNKESEEMKQKYIPIDIADLENLGMKVDLINLEDLTEEKIVSVFEPYDIIYVYGGNTFYLMHHVNKSGFKKHIKEIVKDKMYVGVSAGSVITGPDIAIAGWKGGDPNTIGLTDMSGLSLVPYSILPHWNGEISKETDTYKHKVNYLKDEEAIVVEPAS